MSDTVLYVRDPQTAQLLPIKAIDNLDGTYSLTDAAGGDASQTTLLAVKTQTDTISAKQDGVYFDELLGSAGTALPIGTATSPVTNLADALTIMTARKLNKLYLAGTGAHAITLTNGINIQIVGNAEYAVTIAAGATVTIDSDLLCKSFTNTTGTPTINGNLTSMTTITSTTGTITVWGNVYAGTTTTMSGAAGTLTIYGDAKLMGNVTTSNGTAVITIGGNAFFGASYTGTSGALTVNGSLNVAVNLANDTATVVVGMGCEVKGTFTTGTGTITISENLYVGSTTSVPTGSTLIVNGSAQLMGDTTTETSTCTIKGSCYIVGNWAAGPCTITTGALIIIGYLTSSGNITVNGDYYSNGVLAHTAGTAVIQGNARSETGDIRTTTGNLTIGGDCWAAVGNISTTTGTFIIYGNAHAGLQCNSTNTGSVTIWGNLYVGTTTTFSGGAGCALVVHGNAILTGAVGATNAAATITIDGFADIRGAITATGAVTYRGIQPEVPINITATNGAETSFLDLSVASTHYAIDDLVLKCVDPGGNSVAVRLYKLVNGASVNITTFTITTVNFGTYFDINTMFGIKSLVGDNIKITVRASAGGPYAVTGSFGYRKT